MAPSSVPGLVKMALLGESVSNASFSIYMPRYNGTIYEVLSAPVSAVEIVIGYVGAAASKSVVLGVLILLTARLFVDYEIEHPLWMVGFLLLTAVTFCLFGFLIGIWADTWEKLQVVPDRVVVLDYGRKIGGRHSGRSSRQRAGHRRLSRRGALRRTWTRSCSRFRETGRSW